MTAAEAARTFNRLLAEDPAAAVEQAAAMDAAFLARGVTFDGAPMRSFLRPHLLARADWEVLRAAGRRLMELAARAARRAFDGDVQRLLDWLGIPEAEARWIRHDPGEPDVVLSRLDAFLAPDGPRFIEVNSDAPAGFGYGDCMAEVIAELPAFRELSRRCPVRYHPSAPALLDAVPRAARGGAPVVAIVDWAEVKTRGDQEILRQAFAARGVTCLLADPRAVDVHDGRLWAEGRAVDVVYRRAVLSELVAREDEVGAFRRAYHEGLAAFVNTFRCQLSEDKAFLALLTDEAFAGLLSPEEQALVDATVPWTRKLEERRTRRHGGEVDLVPFVLAHREELVLKPAHSYGGRSVFVGTETPAGEWERAVAAGVGKPWVVQERVAIPEEEFPVVVDGQLRFEALGVNANPFYVAGADAGAVARASHGAVINVSAGGGSMPTFVVG
ncbi:MAG TPA: circularly permuted type 2 ATP-grasp protein [Vicinamibacteria bacterium]